MIISVETYTESQTGKTIYRKKRSDGSVDRIGRGEFMRLWFRLTGCVFPNHPEVEQEP